MFCESQQGTRVGEQHRGVENVSVDMCGHEDPCGVSTAEIRVLTSPDLGLVSTNYCQPIPESVPTE
ncbi:hypothetical protein GCM10009691_00140 [Brevibacterium picturae]|uniref:Uncharacterized protein n=1 Tax=Brevibacterium picturae TaxID=260553 RepID=A0ABP4LNQ5_9MICO